MEVALVFTCLRAFKRIRFDRSLDLDREKNEWTGCSKMTFSLISLINWKGEKK